MEAIKLNHEFFTHVERDEECPLDQLLDDAKIDPTEELPPPPVCWQIVNENGDHSTIGTLGNFSLIIGKAKSRKTFFIGLALSAAIKNGLILNRFKGTLLKEQSEVLYFDTEQGKYHVLQAVKRVCDMVKVRNPKNLHSYGLRKFPPEKRLAMIEHAIYLNEKVGFVVIDGIKDLITSINDEAQATMLTSKLMKWTEERNIHIVTVLHQNKGDNNARGHIGSELMNKAETVLSITKSPDNKDISIVEAEYCRDKEPEPFAFEIDENGMPLLVENWQSGTAKKTGADKLSPEQIYGLLCQCFIKEQELKYNDLVIQMKLAYESRLEGTIGDNKAKKLITECKNRDWIFQEKTKGEYRRRKEFDGLE